MYHIILDDNWTIIEDDMSCAWPFYSLVQIFPKALHSDWQGDGDYMTGLVEAASEETRPQSSSPLISDC